MSEHLAERVRDVPRICTCIWEWDVLFHRWVTRWATFGCPWHQGGK